MRPIGESVWDSRSSTVSARACTPSTRCDSTRRQKEPLCELVYYLEQTRTQLVFHTKMQARLRTVGCVASAPDSAAWSTGCFAAIARPIGVSAIASLASTPVSAPACGKRRCVASWRRTHAAWRMFVRARVSGILVGRIKKCTMRKALGIVHNAARFVYLFLQLWFRRAHIRFNSCCVFFVDVLATL